MKGIRSAVVCLQAITHQAYTVITQCKSPVREAVLFFPRPIRIPLLMLLLLRIRSLIAVLPRPALHSAIQAAMRAHTSGISVMAEHPPKRPLHICMLLREHIL